MLPSSDNPIYGRSMLVKYGGLALTRANLRASHTQGSLCLLEPQSQEWATACDTVQAAPRQAGTGCSLHV